MEQEPIDKILDDTLKKELDFVLPVNFTDQVLQKIEAANESSDKNLFWILLGTGLLMSVSSFIAIFMFWEIELPDNILPYASWTILLTTLIGLIQYLDNKLVKNNLDVPKLG